MIDDSGDRKDGTATAHVGRQWLGRLGKTDNGIVTVTTVWTDGRVYYPLHATPYTPAHHFARGRSDPAFRTKPQLAAALAARSKEAGFDCRAVVADCAYLLARLDGDSRARILSTECFTHLYVAPQTHSVQNLSP
ncbi:transposase [Streptomyces sp. NPDC021080]|uniref:transposase n=1 Tax=Streptomyces sp. NPDC021080 TaxID=3365110 RepID=UPI0037ADB261